MRLVRGLDFGNFNGLLALILSLLVGFNILMVLQCGSLVSKLRLTNSVVKILAISLCLGRFDLRMYLVCFNCCCRFLLVNSGILCGRTGVCGIVLFLNGGTGTALLFSFLAP